MQLARAIRQGEISASEVVEAHIARLTDLQTRARPLAFERFAEARREAAEADRLVARGDADVLPPLLGVPFTVKESIAVAGMPQSAGLLARREYRSAVNAPAVQRLVDAGAMPLGVTNVSELTLWIESSNPLYGRTSNPYDVSRTAGGSSGGEGAAVGGGGAPFGLASDIAGSIRIPALFCGVFGHKPSAGLVPNTGLWPPSRGDAGRMLGTGPLARRAEDLMPLLRLIAGPDGVDSVAVAPAPLRDPGDVSLAGLCVTVVEDTSLLPLSQPLRDARERAVGALLAAGGSARTVELRSWRGGVWPFLATLQAASGGGRTGAARMTLALLTESGEPAPTWRSLLRPSTPHSPSTRAALAMELLPDGLLGGGRAARRRAELLEAGRDLVDELLEAIGDGVLLHPAHPRVAPRHGRTFGQLWLLTPAAMFNLAGVPVTEVPLGLSAEGLPVGIQVAAAPGRDDLTIAVALELERVFGGWVSPRG